MLTDRSPAGLAHRLTVANRAGPFGPNGFSPASRPPWARPWQRVLDHPHAVVAGTAAGSSSSASSSRPSSASAGTLSVSTGRLALASVNGTATGRFTLTAQGGPVSGYSVTVDSTLAGHITVSPSSGSLASGVSVTITVTSTSLVALAGQLTGNPGGQTITVLLSIGM